MNFFSNILIVFLIVLNVSAVTSQTISCQTVIQDTLKYVEISKSVSLATISVNSINDGGAYGYAAYGQRFEAPDSITLIGFCFYGFVNSGNSDTVICRLYTVDQNGFPDIELESVIVNVPLNIGYNGSLNSSAIQIGVNFNSLHIIEGDYIVTVENFSTSEMYLTRNEDGDGSSEDLALTYYRGLSDPSFDGWYKTFPFGVGWDFDLLFEPIIEYTVESEIIVSDDTLCSGDTVYVNSTINSFDDSVFYHRMYNSDYSSYMGYTVSSFFDYGDSFSDTLGFHSYNSGGSFLIQALDSLSIMGWTTSFNGVCSDSLIINDVMLDLGNDTIICQGTSYILDAGLYDNYNWNSGQTTSSIQVGPFLNTDTVLFVLQVTGNGCSSTDSIQVIIDNCTNLNKVSSNVLVYPVPAKDQITIDSKNINLTKIEIYDLKGRLLKSQISLGAREHIAIDFLTNGNYLLVISTKNEHFVKLIEIIK